MAGRTARTAARSALEFTAPVWYDQKQKNGLDGGASGIPAAGELEKQHDRQNVHPWSQSPQPEKY